ncbi:hypothetical protein [Flavobacterium sp. UGB4466]|uniref:hypothetical protein n=1 Tax=Flavobacterium sp. UGB4466 TaxID=2730889 RepID=UPI00192B3308|nr:hypothetical protein [Flavobacterium sp. UGB4466]
MYGLTKKQKLEFILKKVGELELTSYDIGKKTNLSISGIEKIINGTSKNPHEKTLDIILELLEKKNIGSDKENTKEKPEPTVNYKANDLIKYAECLEKENKLIKEIVRLQGLLRDNNVDFDNFFENERK